MQTLGLAMIARDEERGLPLALASVRDYVDQIVVAVDSRTVDGTREAADGASVFDVQFEDFAQMRLAVFREMKTDWVLMLDADEILEGDPRPLMKTRVIWELPRHHWMDFERRIPAAQDAWWPDHQRRLLPNEPRIHWRRPVHEVATGMRWRKAEYPVLHHFKEALQTPARKQERLELYRALVKKGQQQGYRYREGKDY